MKIVPTTDESGEELEEFVPVEDQKLEAKLMEIATLKLNDEPKNEIPCSRSGKFRKCVGRIQFQTSNKFCPMKRMTDFFLSSPASLHTERPTFRFFGAGLDEHFGTNSTDHSFHTALVGRVC